MKIVKIIIISLVVLVMVGCESNFLEPRSNNNIDSLEVVNYDSLILGTWNFSKRIIITANDSIIQYDYDSLYTSFLNDTMTFYTGMKYEYHISNDSIVSKYSYLINTLNDSILIFSNTANCGAANKINTFYYYR